MKILPAPDKPLTTIRRLRMEKGLRVPDLSRRANAHLADGYRLDSGSAKAGPSVRQRFADALGVEVSLLFDEQGWPLFEEAR